MDGKAVDKVSPGGIPAKLRPGTPSIGDGVRMPCQWIELGSAKRFVTASVTASPSRQRRIGAGTEPLTPVAVTGRPAMFSGTGSISSAKSVPLKTGARGPAHPRRSGQGTAASTPAAAMLCTKRRRVIPVPRAWSGIIVRLPPA